MSQPNDTAASSPSPGLRTIAQISVPILDLDRAVAFYRDVLALPFLFRAEPGMAFFAIGGIRLMLARGESPDEAPPGSVLYFATDAIEPSWQALLARGAEPVGAPHLVARLEARELWLAFFRDTEGNLLALSEERPTS
jgi:predicted enzyme related to lactoylglutathione lyase